MATKALKLLQTKKSVTERAIQYADRVAKSLELKVINPLKEEIESMEDQIHDLENFALETDANAGHKQMTKEEIEDRFNKILSLNFKIDLAKAKLKSYQEAYDHYFKEEK